MAYTQRYNARVVDNGGGDVSGDFTSGVFTTLAGTLLVAVVMIDNQNGNLPTAQVPLPSTAGTTWVAKLQVDSATRNFSTGINIYEADSPGAGAANTFAMAGSGFDWDNSINCVDLYILEFDNALAVASQTSIATASAKSDNNSGVDPGAQTLTLSAAPASSSYVLAAAALDGDPTGVTVGSGFTELMERLGTSSGPYMTSQIQIRTGSTSTSVPWADLQEGSGTHIFDYRLAAIEILATSAGTFSPPPFRRLDRFQPLLVR